MSSLRNLDPAVPVPHLTTAQTGPLQQIEQHIVERQADIEAWFRSQWRRTPVPFYASVDLRNSGYKLAPVDTNLFPAGFNNLNPAFEALCIQAAQDAVEHLPEQVNDILIIPENHTRNFFYLESLANLREILTKAGFRVRLGSLSTELETPLTVELPSGNSVLLEALERRGKQLFVADFVPDLILLNNDLSSGRPALLEDLEQTVTPPLDLGWSQRLKSNHSRHYQALAAEFSKLIEIDSWLINPLFKNCGEVDFMRRKGTPCLERNVDILLRAIREKYDEYSIECEPFVIIKAESGTYGMGIMTVKDVAEVSELNRKQRTRMATIKEGRKVTNVIIQEGVYTHETWGDIGAVAEPVVYMIGHHVVGGFYRAHEARAANENLNAPGMRFEPLAFDDCCVSPVDETSGTPHPNRFYAYGVIARLALLAAARENAAISA